MYSGRALVMCTLGARPRAPGYFLTASLLGGSGAAARLARRHVLADDLGRHLDARPVGPRLGLELLAARADLDADRGLGLALDARLLGHRHSEEKEGVCEKARESWVSTERAASHRDRRSATKTGGGAVPAARHRPCSTRAPAAPRAVECGRRWAREQMTFGSTDW